jgi:hypothetical protein
MHYNLEGVITTMVGLTTLQRNGFSTFKTKLIHSQIQSNSLYKLLSIESVKLLEWSTEAPKQFAISFT